MKQFFALLALLVLPVLLSPEYAHAASWEFPCVTEDEVATLQGLECAFANIISAALAISAIVIFIMFLIGGLRYITSGGDPKAVEGARATLTHAVAGLVILILAFVILVLLKNITGVDVTKFKVRTD